MTLAEVVIGLVESMYIGTGHYPAEIVLPREAWISLAGELERVCRFETEAGERGAVIVLAQGTRIRAPSDGFTPRRAAGPARRGRAARAPSRRR